MQRYTTGHWMTLLVLSAIWGCSFLFMKNGLETFSWDEVAAMRISISFICTTPILLIYSGRLKRKELPYYFLTGLFGSGIPAYCFTFAETHIASGITGVLNSLTPVFTFVLGILFFRMAFEVRKLYGLIVALAGAVFLVAYSSPDSGASRFIYALPVFLATMSYAMSANIIKRHLQTAHPLALGAAGFSFIGIPSIIYLLTTDFATRSGDPHFAISLSSVIALSVFGTVIASIMYYAVIQKTDPVFGSLVAYFIPLVAVVLGLLDGERLYSHDYVGIAGILLGIYIINTKGRRIFFPGKKDPVAGK